MTPQFAKAVDPIFETALRFFSKIESLQTNSSINTSDERAKLTSGIDAADKALGRSNKKAWELAKYALCCWIDSRLINSPWKESNWWKSHSLELHYFKTQAAKEQFFVKASIADNLAERDALEVFYLAVVLGFRGFYDEPSVAVREKARELDVPESLERWFQKFTKSLDLRQGRPEIPCEAIVGGKNTTLNGKKQLLQYSLISLVLLALAILLWSGYLNQWWLALIGLPIVCIFAGITYWFLVLKRKKESSNYPDIDRVMMEGFQQLAASGISVSTTPIFIVLGTQDFAINRRLLEAANLKTPIVSPKSGEGPLSIHASKEAIWIMPHHCNAISRLSNSSHSPPAKSTQASRNERDEEDDDIQGTMVVEESIPDLDDEDDDGDWGAGAGGKDDDSGVPGGTIQLTDDFDLGNKKGSISSSVVQKRIQVQDLADTEDRLRHICAILRNTRKNICPINGLVTTIPFELIESNEEQLSIALQADLKVLRNELQVRVANTLLVTGMENEPGFIAMTMRLGSQRTKKARIGKGSEVWVSPENKRLAALAKHATAVFEDLCFELFQEEDRFQDKQNTKLFSLLSRMRGAFAQNLSKIMETGFGFDPLRQPELSDIQFLFSGCYFIACGTKKDRQAFVPSAINKVIEVGGDREWVKDVSQKNTRDRRIANVIALVAGLGSLIAIVAMLTLWISSKLQNGPSN
jgi:type IV/VI secretion system ImpK/VasF family protein